MWFSFFDPRKRLAALVLTPMLQVRKVSRSRSHRVRRTGRGRSPPPGLPRSSSNQGASREAHVSTSQSAQKEKARLSPQNEDKERPPGIEAAAGEGPGTSFGIVPREGGADQRLPASERIRHRPEFERVYDEGQPHRSSLLVLFVWLAPELARKAGFVAGRRVGGAVARNRSKRLMREAYRRNKSLLPEAGVHLVIVARNGCGEATYGDVESQLLSLFERAGLTRAASRKDTQ